jgi:RimJ/RimL family protein N-acetyltransferase
MPDPHILCGSLVRLTALDEKDLETVASWYQDAGFLRQLDAAIARPRTESELQAWMANAHKSKSGFLFAIRPVQGDEILGFLEIDGILWNQQTGFVSIAIGDHHQRGQGYGYEAMQLALRFAFDELNLHRLSLNVFSYNQRAIAPVSYTHLTLPTTPYV